MLTFLKKLFTSNDKHVSDEELLKLYNDEKEKGYSWENDKKGWRVRSISYIEREVLSRGLIRSTL